MWEKQERACSLAFRAKVVIDSQKEVTLKIRRHEWEGEEGRPVCTPKFRTQRLRADLQINLHGWLQAGWKRIAVAGPLEESRPHVERPCLQC